MTAWRDAAACRDMDSNLWFPSREHSGGYGQARRICDGCPVKIQCLDEAMGFEAGAAKVYREGMYGGLSPAQRYELSLGRLRSRRVPCVVCGRLFDPGVRGRLCCTDLCRDVRAVDRARLRNVLRRGKRHAA